MQNLVSNMTFLSLAVASFVGVPPALQAHDYPVSVGLVVLGLILFFLYEKTPPTTPAV